MVWRQRQINGRRDRRASGGKLRRHGDIGDLAEEIGLKRHVPRRFRAGVAQGKFRRNLLPRDGGARVNGQGNRSGEGWQAERIRQHEQRDTRKGQTISHNVFTYFTQRLSNFPF